MAEEFTVVKGRWPGRWSVIGPDGYHIAGLTYEEAQRVAAAENAELEENGENN